MTTRQNERDVMNLTTYLRLRFLKNVLKDDSGQDLLEYALLVALIALVCVGVITSAGSGVKTIFTNITGELTKAATP
jgi:pilus assembly protein Flp/PilA